MTKKKFKLIEKLQNYNPENDIEKYHKDEMLEYLQTAQGYLFRTNFDAHITGSAFVVSDDWRSVLLTHHRKLDIWIQLGGHCDGESDILQVAWRETIEESGLKSTKPFGEEVFDLDIQIIPERKSEPSHRHMDIRFLFVADRFEKIRKQEEETKEIKWVGIDEVRRYTSQKSILRAIEKIKKIAKIRKPNINLAFL